MASASSVILLLLGVFATAQRFAESQSAAGSNMTGKSIAIIITMHACAAI